MLHIQHFMMQNGSWTILSYEVKRNGPATTDLTIFSKKTLAETFVMNSHSRWKEMSRSFISNYSRMSISSPQGN